MEKTEKEPINLQELPNCKHCKKNENAQMPFSKMAQINLGPEVQKDLEELSEKHGIDTECFVCQTIEQFMQMPWEQQIALLKRKN